MWTMGSPTIGAQFDQAELAVVFRAKERFAPSDDVYTENPMGAFRGLAFAMVFNALLVLAGAAAWELWRLLR
jgi:hypothetical protein